MNYQEEYKRIYFNLIIINKKINDLKHSKVINEYINNAIYKDDYLINKFNSLIDEKNDLLIELDNLYHEMELNNIYLNSPLELTLCIYQRLKDIYPNLDNNTINHFIKVSLYNMKYKDNTFDRQQSRIKRLKLNNLYNNWYYNVEK